MDPKRSEAEYARMSTTKAISSLAQGERSQSILDNSTTSSSNAGTQEEPVAFNFQSLLNEFQQDQERAKVKVIQSLSGEPRGVLNSLRLQLEKTQKDMLEVKAMEEKNLVRQKHFIEADLALLEREKVSLVAQLMEKKERMRAKVEQVRGMVEGRGRTEEALGRLKGENERLEREIEEKRERNRGQMGEIGEKKGEVERLQGEEGALKENIEVIQQRLENMQRRKLEYYPKFQKQLLKQYFEFKGNTRVIVRVRPVLAQDYKAYDEKACQSESGVRILNGFQVEVEAVEKQAQLFTFDSVFGPEADQGDVYKEVNDLVQACLDGSDVCIFAYGQTGSGKTYTMGTEVCRLEQVQNQGIIPRAVKQILEQQVSAPLFVSVFEIYLDSVRDLLDPHNVLTNSNQFGKYEPTSVQVASYEEVMALLKKGESLRVVAENQCNERSSRSHYIFQIKLQNSVLCLVDLAGSERTSLTKVDGERMKETQAINKSLSALADVISAIKQKSKHIPFRNSKLTYILQPQLTKEDSKCLMIVNLNPVSQNESLCSLRFASQVNSCQVK